ncbi:hypothetical protein HDU98_006417 [Podochytrium sp. JEL0797]|nr:hypothetical protein HDU98_006417 [Podochytrium sp. JEL0797]
MSEKTNRPAGINLAYPPDYLSHMDPSDSSAITVVDYCDTAIEATVLSNETLPAFLKQPRKEWSKVRWINMQHLSLSAMTTLSLHFRLHPLTIEDVFHLPQRIKADFLENHLYVSMLLPLIKMPSGFANCGIVKEYDVEGLPVLFEGHQAKMKGVRMPTAELEQLVRPDVYLEECSFFLLENGVILSIFQNSGRQITDRLLETLYGAQPPSPSGTPSISAGTKRVETPLPEFLNALKRSADNSRLTTLRKSNDRSFLLHSLMDGVVDHYFVLSEFYERQIGAIQDAVLDRPKASYTKTLHLILKEVSMIRRRLQPTEKLLITLKDDQYEDHLAKSCANLAASSKSDPERMISKLTKTYFADVLDHCWTVLEELSAIEQTASQLIDLTFNMISHQTNENMKILNVISFVFLPITFLAGVYGMNFIDFPELQYGLGVLYFWILASLLIVASLGLSYRMGLLGSS